MSHRNTIDKDSSYRQSRQSIIRVAATEPLSAIREHKFDKNSSDIVARNAGHIRRLYEGSDIRVCEDCGRKGDRWDIEEHLCKE